MTEGGQEYLPWSQALVAVADERFAFVFAVSQKSSNEARLSKLESGVAGLQCSNSWRLSGRAQRPDQALGCPAATRSGSQFRSIRPGYERHVAEMARMVGGRKSSLKDAPKKEVSMVSQQADILGESLEPELLPDSLPEAPAGHPMAAALVKLTSIVDHLSARRTKKNSLENRREPSYDGRGQFQQYLVSTQCLSDQSVEEGLDRLAGGALRLHAPRHGRRFCVALPTSPLRSVFLGESAAPWTA